LGIKAAWEFRLPWSGRGGLPRVSSIAKKGSGASLSGRQCLARHLQGIEALWESRLLRPVAVGDPARAVRVR